MSERGMTISEVKAFLRHYRDISTRIDIKRAEIERLRSIAARTSPSQNIGGSNHASDCVGSIAAKIADIDAEICAEIDELHRARNEVMKAAAMLPAKKYGRCIILRYVDGLNFYKIAEIMNYSTRQVYNIHGAALHMLCRILKKSNFRQLI